MRLTIASLVHLRNAVHYPVHDLPLAMWVSAEDAPTFLVSA